MNIVDLLLSSALCWLPLVVITIVVAYLATKAKLRSAKRIITDVRSGVYDKHTNPSLYRKLRIYVIASLFLGLVVMCAVFGLMAYDLLPVLQQKLTFGDLASGLAVFLVALVVLSLILWVIYERIIEKHR